MPYPASKGVIRSLNAWSEINHSPLCHGAIIGRSYTIFKPFRLPGPGVAQIHQSGTFFMKGRYLRSATICPFMKLPKPTEDTSVYICDSNGGSFCHIFHMSYHSCVHHE